MKRGDWDRKGFAQGESVPNSEKTRLFFIPYLPSIFIYISVNIIFSTVVLRSLIPGNTSKEKKNKTLWSRNVGERYLVYCFLQESQSTLEYYRFWSPVMNDPVQYFPNLYCNKNVFKVIFSSTHKNTFSRSCLSSSDLPFKH